MDGRRTLRGFSIVELTIGLAILAIVVAWATPAFHNTLLDTRRAAAVNAFMHTLYSARSESITRAEFVSICPSRDQQQCSRPPVDWSEGWIVFVNLDHDQPASVDPGEPVVERHPPLDGIHVMANRDSLVYRHDSFTGTTASFFFCDPRGGRSARAVIISQVGRPRLSQSDAYGKPLRCN